MARDKPLAAGCDRQLLTAPPWKTAICIMDYWALTS
jgi:hypothetical protein